MAWNTNATGTKGYQVDRPPLGNAWCVGCVGPKDDGKGLVKNNGTWEAYGEFVEPASLFAAQLKDRGFDFAKLGL